MCTHVSGLLHALVALSPSKSVPPPVADRNDYDSEDELPVTSYRCQWALNVDLHLLHPTLWFYVF